MTQFNDRVTASSTVRRTPEGYLVTTARVARSGVQEYLGREVGRPDMPTVKLYRPEDEVFSDATMRSFAHRPMTLNHPSQQVDASNWRDVAVGNTGAKVHRDGDYIVVDLVMMDQKAIAAYEAGTRELSMGYDAVIDFTSGTTPKGEPYDAVQRQIRNNHLALVGKARGGSALRVGDGAAPVLDAAAQAVQDQARMDHFREGMKGSKLADGEVEKLAQQFAVNFRPNPHHQKIVQDQQTINAARAASGYASDNAYAETCQQLQNAHRRA